MSTENLNDLDNTVDSKITDKEIKRLTFLTVLCVLTFIGSGLGFFNALTAFFSPDKVIEANHQLSEELSKNIGILEDADASERLIDFFVHYQDDVLSNATEPIIKTSSSTKGLSCIITLIGAILMWKLRKNGFYIYLTGLLLYVASPIIAFHGYVLTVSLIANGFIAILFAILYAVNVKHMRN